MAASSTRSHQVNVLVNVLNWIDEHENESLRCPSQCPSQYESSRTALACGITWASQHESAPDKSSGIVWSNNINTDQKLRGIFYEIHATKNWSWRGPTGVLVNKKRKVTHFFITRMLSNTVVCLYLWSHLDLILANMKIKLLFFIITVLLLHLMS